MPPRSAAASALSQHGRDVSWEASQSLSPGQALGSRGMEMVQNNAPPFFSPRCSPSQEDQGTSWKGPARCSCGAGEDESGHQAQPHGTVSHRLPPRRSLQYPAGCLLMAGVPLAIVLGLLPECPLLGRQHFCSRRRGHKLGGELSFSPR